VAHAAEATVADERISVDSPLGRALLGRHVGDSVEVEVPKGSYRCTITQASRRADHAVSDDG
jgi:transcription elongation GreA/GreB family factor